MTDELFFGGNNKDFVSSRKELSIPMLRKDFIIDEFQLIESKSIGADVILLIASCLNDKEILKFSKLAKSLSLEVILEVHSEEELNYSLNPYVDIVGVNNRNLNNFTTDINNSIKLSSFIPKDFCKNFRKVEFLIRKISLNLKVMVLMVFNWSKIFIEN